MKKYYVGVLLLLSLIGLTMYNVYRVKEGGKKSLKGNENLLVEKMRKLYLIGKKYEGGKIKSLQAILGDSIYHANKQLIIFLYNGFDCNTCIIKGLKEALVIDSLLKKNDNKVMVIGANTDFGNDQMNSGYHKYIFDDKRELIRKELKFLYTPIFIQLNKKKIIKNIYYPFPEDDNLYLKEFIIGIKSLEKKG
jgi:hypothetical protein